MLGQGLFELVRSGLDFQDGLENVGDLHQNFVHGAGKRSLFHGAFVTALEVNEKPLGSLEEGDDSIRVLVTPFGAAVVIAEDLVLQGITGESLVVAFAEQEQAQGRNSFVRPAFGDLSQGFHSHGD